MWFSVGSPLTKYLQRCDSIVCSVFVCHFRAQAVAFFSGDEEQANVNSLLAQSFSSGDLRGDDAFGVAGASAEDARGVFRRRNEGRNRVHVRGENYGGMLLLRRNRVDVKAIAFDRHFLGLVAEAAEFSVEIVSDRGFVAGNRFDVDELASERDGVHCSKNKLRLSCAARDVASIM